MGKSEFVHQSNVFDWYKNEFEVRVCNSTRKMKDRKKHKQLYYQYNLVDDTKRRMNIGEGMPGFQVKGSSNIYVAYGHRQRSDYTNLACIKQQNKGVGKMVLGLAYVKCKQRATMLEMEVKMMGQSIQNYVLLLPLIIKDEFNQKYAVIYHDWDVSDVNHEKTAKLMRLLF